MNVTGNSIPSIPTLSPINFGIISLLQLAYWYNKCSVSSTFDLKENELREKLTGFIKAFDEPGSNLNSKLEKIRNGIDDYVSELMFAGLALNSGKSLSFNGTNDLLINDNPCEVKTIHDEIGIARTEDGKLVPGSKKETFGELSLKSETVEQLVRGKYKGDIKKAIEQGGRIIFINASFSTVAHNIASVDFEYGVNGDEKFNTLLQKALLCVQNNSASNLPIIVGIALQAYERGSIVFYHTYYSFYIRTTIGKDRKVMLDENTYTSDITNSIDVNDVGFKKYPFDESTD
jgi:hypothetical protein